MLKQNKKKINFEMDYLKLVLAVKRKQVDATQ